MDPILFGIAAIAFTGGLLNGISGFGALIVMTPLFVFLLGLETAVPLGILCGTVLQVFASVIFRSQVRVLPLAVMLLASLPGIWLGCSLLIHAPEVWLKAALGLLVMAYVGWTLLAPSSPGTGQPALGWAALAGLCSGLFGGAFGIAGPPAVMYASRTDWPTNAIRGFLGLFFGMLFLTIAIMLFARGMVPPHVWPFAVFVIPMSLAGSWAGRRVAANIKRHHYMHLVLMLLGLMGLSLCWPAVKTVLAN